MTYRIETPEDLLGAIDLMQRAGAIGWAHLLRALRAGRIAMLPLVPEESATKLKAFIRLTSHRPAVILVGDDDGLDGGPDRWPTAQRAVRWARAIVIHGGGAEIYHYELAIAKAEAVGRVLFIECSTRTFPAWCGLVAASPNRPSVLTVSTPDGNPHPAPMPKAGLH